MDETPGLSALLTIATSTPAKGGTLLPRQPVLTVDEQKLNDVWNEHLRAEFDAHSADETVATMVAEPLINEVPVMIGGDGKEEVYEFYAKFCLTQRPPDFTIFPVSTPIRRPRRPRTSDRR